MCRNLKSKMSPTSAASATSSTLSCAPGLDAIVMERAVSQLSCSHAATQALVRSDGPPTRPKRMLWADLAELEVSELEEGEPVPVLPVALTARKSRVHWAYPLINVIEFCVDGDQE